MPDLDQSRLVRKEVSLGTLRDLEPPQDHIGLRTIAPFLEVATDEVIFDYAKGLTTGMVNARAEDAEAELAQKDLMFGGQGRASVIDWAQKDHYNASDVNRYRESLLISNLPGINQANGMRPLVTIESNRQEFQAKLARDATLRRKKIDNRLEWMIMTALETSGITYNDGKIKFSISYGRPGGQTDQTPAGGTWDLNTSDPIGDLLGIQETMYETYGVHLTRGITSRKVLNTLANSDRFIAQTGLVKQGYGFTTTDATERTGTPIDPNYLIPGWGPSAAQQIIEQATGIRFEEYDAVYRTRPVGGTTVTNNRFLNQKKVFLLPNPAELDDIDDTQIGFGKMLTSPHPEGNWTPGYYEWEIETKDPWGMDRGTGLKAFPVFPHMDLTYSLTVLP
jgi:hypothetical protein